MLAKPEGLQLQPPRLSAQDSWFLFAAIVQPAAIDAIRIALKGRR